MVTTQKKGSIVGVFFLIVSLIAVGSLGSAAFVAAVSNTTKLIDIGHGLFYNEQSSIAQWSEALPNSSKNDFADNVNLYENESQKYSDYYAERNARIIASFNSTTEPPFTYDICLRDTVTGKATFCSCGDGVCTSYEDKCTCPEDCGSCPSGTVCKMGDCIKFVPNTCSNTVCELGENVTCPWDCNVEMVKSEEENLTQEEINSTRERIRENSRKFVELHGEVYVEDAENQTPTQTLPEVATD